MFNALPKQERLTVQRSMAKKDLYSSTIDGAWGRNTLIGLGRFSAEHLNTINLRSKSNIKLVLDGLIAQVALNRTQMASLSVLENVAKKDAGFVKVASSSSSMKSAYVGEPVLRRKQIQYALKKLGFYASGVDGLWGNGTASALASYQNEEGLQSSSSSQIFRRILSEVDVPSSFAVARRQNSSNQSNSGGLTAIISRPSMSGAQALATCKPQANLARSQAGSSYRAPSYGNTITCRSSFGSSVNCNSRANSGGFAGGFASGLARGMIRNNAYSAVLDACLASYGWKK
jgi:hypothetical protein